MLSEGELSTLEDAEYFPFDPSPRPYRPRKKINSTAVTGLRDGLLARFNDESKNLFIVLAEDPTNGRHLQTAPATDLTASFSVSSVTALASNPTSLVGVERDRS